MMKLAARSRNQEFVMPGQTPSEKLFSAKAKQCSPREGMRSATRWPWGLLVFLAALLSPAALHAQTLAPVPALSFTKTLDSASNPLPQVFTVTSTGASFGISATATTSTGGNWLSVQSGGECCSNATPNTLIATANPSVNLAAGTYSGQIKVTQSSSPYASLTIPVTLTIEAANATYFDELPGGLTFTMQTSEAGPAPQTLPIRNAGTGTLNWTSSVSTSDGGAWLSLSAASGTAPSTPAVSINPANLPNGGRVAGTFAGQVLLKSAAGSVSVPVTVTVGSSVLSQVNPLSFTKTVFSASNPLAQQVNLDDTGTSIGISVQSFNGTGGSWLSVQLAGDCCGYATPVPLTVTVAPNINLAVGTYTAEIVVTGGPEVEVIPVTLAVEPTTATYFDALPGELTFSMQTGGSAPPVQPLPIRNAGAGTLSWTASTSTADRGNWLTLSATSGTAPSTPNVGINPANLPGGGLLAGTFSGQIVLQSGGDTVTIPVTVTVGAAVFRQINGLNFTKTVDSAGNPLSQVITIASTGANFGLYATAVEGTGGNWLSIQYGGSCCGYSTPQTLTVTANPATNLAAGTYSAEILIQAASGSGEAQVVPVTLTIEPASATFFDELPGQLTFSMQTGGAAPPSELVQIRNAGAGTLNFTAAESTADGGSWIVLSASSGAAPYLLSVSVNPAKLPGAGLVAGTFTGQVVLTTAGNTVTIPVTATVGDSVLRQLSPLNFSTRVNSTSTPMPQVITVASTDNNFGMYATAVEGTGGNWLSIQYGGGCCGYSTPQTLTVSVTPAVTLAAGTYTAEIIIQASNGSEPEVVPVTLTVEPVSAAYFDSLPGALTFSGQATGAAIASQPLNIRNAGPGLLNWMASTTTADGGKWLTLSSTSGVPRSWRSPSPLPSRRCRRQVTRLPCTRPAIVSWRRPSVRRRRNGFALRRR